MKHFEGIVKSDEWYTPKYVFDALGCKFDMDVASPFDRKNCNVPATDFITKESLRKQWRGFVWMNPPFSGRSSKGLWLDKIYEHGMGIALTPDRSSSSWWQKAATQADAHLQVNGRICFIKQDGTKGDSPNVGTTLFAYGDKAVKALLTAQSNGLGLVFKKITTNTTNK